MFLQPTIEIKEGGLRKKAIAERIEKTYTPILTKHVKRAVDEFF